MHSRPATHPGETPSSCPEDCGCPADLAAGAKSECGDGVCDAWAGENCVSCPEDCVSTYDPRVPLLNPFSFVEDNDLPATDEQASTTFFAPYCCGGGNEGHGCDEALCSSASSGDALASGLLRCRTTCT